MGNPLLAFWHRMVDAEPGRAPVGEASPGGPTPMGAAAPGHSTALTSGAIFLVLRRMRMPLIVLIVIFSISVVGLTLIPGQQPDGGTDPMSFFEAFYFMSFTATTIGFGEIPFELTTDQRLWVTLTIYVAVIGWAFAIGTLLALLQDRGFRKALDTQRFTRQVARIPEPFLIVIGYGQAGALVVRALDAKGRRMVVVDRSQDRLDALELEPVRSDIPALSATTREPEILILAGLQRPNCEGVLALTDDDDANLGVVQAVHLLRPGLPVITRSDSPAVATRMAAFGDPTVVNPFDAFGDRLRITLVAPTLAQLVEWLISPPGAPLPTRPAPPEAGAWVVVGSQGPVTEVMADLRLSGRREVTPVAASGRESVGPEDPHFASLAADAVGLVAAADRDTLNVSYVDFARRAHPGIFVAARQESPANAALFEALAPDLLLVPAEVVAREILERLGNPALWEFLQLARGQGEQWADSLVTDLVERCGAASPTVWAVTVDDVAAPALCRRTIEVPVPLSALLASPFGRSDRLAVMALMLVRDGRSVLVPPESTELRIGDELLMAGGPGTQRAWDALLFEDDMLAYVLSGESVATSWWGRRVLRR